MWAMILSKVISTKSNALQTTLIAWHIIPPPPPPRRLDYHLLVLFPGFPTSMFLNPKPFSINLGSPFYTLIIISLNAWFVCLYSSLLDIYFPVFVAGSFFLSCLSFPLPFFLSFLFCFVLVAQLFCMPPPVHLN